MFFKISFSRARNLLFLFALTLFTQSCVTTTKVAPATASSVSASQPATAPSNPNPEPKRFDRPKPRGDNRAYGDLPRPSSVDSVKANGTSLGQGVYFWVTGTKYHIGNDNSYPVWVRIQLYKVNPFGETENGGVIERRVPAKDSIWRPNGGIWNKGRLLKLAKAE